MDKNVNYRGLIERLRNKSSRDNKKLLTSAADAIETLVRENEQCRKEIEKLCLDEKSILALRAGARAIFNNKRLSGTVYAFDVFGDTKEISYYEAAIVLSQIADLHELPDLPEVE